MGDWVTTSVLLSELRDFGNQAAWDRLADRFREPVVAFARKMGLTPSQAEDAAQETLLAFAEAFRDGKYDPAKGRLNRWLFGIAFRQVLNAKRARGRAPKQTSIE